VDISDPALKRDPNQRRVFQQHPWFEHGTLAAGEPVMTIARTQSFPARPISVSSECFAFAENSRAFFGCQFAKQRSQQVLDRVVKERFQNMS